MAETNGAAPEQAQKRLVITIAPHGAEMQLQGMTPDEAEMWMLKMLANLQRGMVLGQINQLLDARRANEKITATVQGRMHV